jgi:hypothetical protein
MIFLISPFTILTDEGEPLKIPSCIRSGQFVIGMRSCNFKCFLLYDYYALVLRLSSCICRFTHSIQWYMNEIWQCETGSHLSQILGVEKCQLQKTTAHWSWTPLYIAFETLLQHPQLDLTRYLSPWKPQACNLESFAAPYVINSADFGPSLLPGITTGWFMLSSCVFNMNTPIYWL